jgi:hypothetical protein
MVDALHHRASVSLVVPSAVAYVAELLFPGVAYDARLEIFSCQCSSERVLR